MKLDCRGTRESPAATQEGINTTFHSGTSLQYVECNGLSQLVQCTQIYLVWCKSVNTKIPSFSVSLLNHSYISVISFIRFFTCMKMSHSPQGNISHTFVYIYLFYGVFVLNLAIVTCKFPQHGINKVLSYLIPYLIYYWPMCQVFQQTAVIEYFGWIMCACCSNWSRSLECLSIQIQWFEVIFG